MVLNDVCHGTFSRYAPLPPKNPSIKYPILVWLHGGGYTGGGDNEERLNGTWNVDMSQSQANLSSTQDTSHRHAVARAADGIIVVVPNYRLGIFGFLGSTEMQTLPTNTTTNVSVGNYGLQDQRLALQWVKQNAHAFHGDADRITIGGQSAGATSASIHMVAKQSQVHDIYKYR